MPISEIHHAALSVRDIERSQTFYCGLLGFRKTLDMPLSGEDFRRLFDLPGGVTARAIILQQGRSQVGEIELTAFEGLSGESPRRAAIPGDPGLFMLSFEVTGEDLDAVAARLDAQGVPFVSKPLSLELPGYGTIAALTVRDPDGVLVELISLPDAAAVKAARR